MIYVEVKTSWEGDYLDAIPVTEEGEAGIGCAKVRNGILCLEGLTIYPLFQGQGIGSILLNQIIQAAREKNVHVLTGSFSPDKGKDEELKRFYAKHGIQVGSNLKLLKSL